MVKKHKQTGIINLATLTRLGRKVYDNDICRAHDQRVATARGPVWMVWFGDPDIFTAYICLEHPIRATARRMLKAALVVGVTSGR